MKEQKFVRCYGIGILTMVCFGIRYWLLIDQESNVNNDIVSTADHTKLLKLQKSTLQGGNTIGIHHPEHTEIDRSHDQNENQTSTYSDEMVSINPSIEETNRGDAMQNETLAEVCKRTASTDKELIVSLIGSGVHDMYMNFYYSSILKHNITNMLFIATDTSACDEIAEELIDYHVSCFVACNDTSSKKQSIFGSEDFKRKVQKRSSIVRDIIKLGYSVLSSDIDIIFFQNPLPVIRKMCALESCDIAIQWNANGEYNGGFLYVKPTKRSQKLYARLLDHGAKYRTGDQASLNYGLKGDSTLKVTTLHDDRFPVGKVFPWGRCLGRVWSNRTVIVHNNFLISPIAKMHRFKQCCLWEYDGKDGYFTSPTRKYLLLSNEYQMNRNMQALLNGFTIASILGRTFILPGTNCQSFCAALTRNYYEQFTGKYRVAAFLSHELVPEGVKTSRSPVYCISRDSDSTNCNPAEVILKCNNPFTGPSENDILKWFKNIKESILVMNPIVQDLQKINYTKILGEKERVFEGDRENHTAIVAKDSE